MAEAWVLRPASGSGELGRPAGPAPARRAAPGNRAGRLVLSLALLLAPLALHAGPQDELKELRNRLQQLQRDLAQSEESRAEAADALAASERAISGANRRLFELEVQLRRTRGTLTALDAQRAQLADSVAQRRARLAEQLRQAYMEGSPSPLVLLLTSRDPNELARRLTYAGYAFRSQAQVLAALQADIGRLDALSAQTAAKANELTRVQAEQAAQRRQLVQEKARRNVILSRVSNEIQRQRQEIGTLRANEERLTRLIRKLAEELAARRAKAARSAKAGKAPRTVNSALPERGDPNAPFARLKGQLHLPVRGELANRFGSPREGTSMPWNGLFIATAPESEVRAVAAGRVVFADWLRGYGNLLILDHGDGYMSL